jgi:hypothetical protein
MVTPRGFFADVLIKNMDHRDLIVDKIACEVKDISEVSTKNSDENTQFALLEGQGMVELPDIGQSSFVAMVRRGVNGSLEKTQNLRMTIRGNKEEMMNLAFTIKRSDSKAYSVRALLRVYADGSEYATSDFMLQFGN